MVDDGRTDDGRTTEHGYTISSPCEPDGSGELKTSNTYVIHSYNRARACVRASACHVCVCVC